MIDCFFRHAATFSFMIDCFSLLFAHVDHGFSFRFAFHVADVFAFFDAADVAAMLFRFSMHLPPFSIARYFRCFSLLLMLITLLHCQLFRLLLHTVSLMLSLRCHAITLMMAISPPLLMFLLLLFFFFCFSLHYFR